MSISKGRGKPWARVALCVFLGVLSLSLGWQVDQPDGLAKQPDGLAKQHDLGQPGVQEVQAAFGQPALLSLGGSADQADTQQPADLPPSEQAPSEQQAVSALRALGATLKTDAQGRVVLVDLGGKAGDAWAKYLAQLPQLRSLRWTGPQVTDASAAVLAGLSHLKVLKLDETRLTDAGLARLKQLAALEELYLARTPITDAGLEHIGQIVRLRRLRLSETKITGAGLAKLAGLKELTELDVSRTVVDDASLAALTKLSHLTRLNLYTTPITDAGLDHLARMVQLTWLNLDNTQVTDAGLPKLRTLKNLEFLHLGRTRISDAGLPSLADLKQLKTLHLTNTAVTAQAAAKLQKALPECKILVGPSEQSKPTEPAKPGEPSTSVEPAQPAPQPSPLGEPSQSAAQLKPAEPAKPAPAPERGGLMPGSGTPGPTTSVPKGLQVRLQCTVRQYDPAKPDGLLVGLVENCSDKPVEVPARYDSHRLLLWAKADEHPMASAYWDRSRQKPAIPMVRLAPGQKQEVFRWPLQELLADRHTTWRADYQAGKRFLVWDWQHHAHPPYSPIYRVNRTELVRKADFWLELNLDDQTLRSEKITLEVQMSSGASAGNPD